MLEVEVKIKADIAAVTDRLISFGFLKGNEVYEYDTYYNGRQLDLKTADKALRIREHKDLGSGEVKYVLNYKGPKVDDVSMTREETQFEIPSSEAGETVLNGLGFYAAGHVEKTRTHYRKGDMNCCLDTVNGLGEFLEIEVMASKEEYERAIDEINGLLCMLDLTMAETLRKSYLCMLEEREDQGAEV